LKKHESQVNELDQLKLKTLFSMMIMMMRSMWLIRLVSLL